MNERIYAFADRIAGRLPRWKYIILILFSAFYFWAICFRAARKLFWFDELFTFYVSRLPTTGAVWNALKHGIDFNPPLFYVLTRFAQSLFGEGQIATRLPEIIGFWIFCLCLFRFVSARASVLAGLIAMLFPLITSAYYYAYEARPHGIVLGFAGLSLVCWQMAIRTAAGSAHRTGWLTGLFLSLLAAISTHTYAVLLVVPFAIAQLVRTLTLRRIDYILWFTIIGPLSGTVISLPLIRASRSAFHGNFWPARLMAIADSYQSHLADAVCVVSAGLILYFIFSCGATRAPVSPREKLPHELIEIVALLAFAALPLFAFALAKLTGAPLLHRYSISAVAGFGSLFGIMMARRTPVGLGILFFLLTQIWVNHVRDSQAGTIIEPSSSIPLATVNSLAHEYELMNSFADKALPIVLLDDLGFLPIMHYAPPEIAPRLVHLVPDSEFDRRGYINLQQCCGAPGRIEKHSVFLSEHQTFLALGSPRTQERLNDFVHAGAEVKVVAVLTDDTLVSVTFHRNRDASAALPSR